MDKNSDLKDDKKSKKKYFLIIIVVICIIVIICFGFMFRKKARNAISSETQIEKFSTNLKIQGNGIETFDFEFMKLNNNEKNMVYSPLSIKYSLYMLENGANGDTKQEITDIIGQYKPVAYVNSNNMSFVNAMFVRDSFKNKVKPDYLNTLKAKYNAQVIYDSFNDATKINNFISDNTFNLLKNVMDDETIKSLDFALVNALAIDMEWINSLSRDFNANFSHEIYHQYVSNVKYSGYNTLNFNNNIDVATVHVAAAVNNYDIVKELGEDNIRQEVGNAWDNYYANASNTEEHEDKDVYLDKYIKEINNNYGVATSSTDFKLYQDEKVTAFSKSLKEYDGLQLEYVAIMPNEMSLKDYIKDIKISDVINIINNLKEIKSENFKQGVITKIDGYIPMFEYEYELPLLTNLKSFGITKVFTKAADLSNIAEKTYIGAAVHKANIEFSNEGIKAAAASVLGGMGSASGGFNYDFEVPIEEIDITFDKPYLYFIRNSKTGEIWFAGKVYEPCEINSYTTKHYN